MTGYRLSQTIGVGIDATELLGNLIPQMRLRIQEQGHDPDDFTLACRIADGWAIVEAQKKTQA